MKMKAVFIEENDDGSYSAYLYGRCICTGTLDECRRSLIMNGKQP
jgi:hypothetical protein